MTTRSRSTLKSIQAIEVRGNGFDETSYATELVFDEDKSMYKEATGLSLTFTLGSGNQEGVGILLRLNKPTAVSFPANFEEHPSSETLDNTKMNVYSLLYFANWDGNGTPRVIYTNSLFTAV